MFTPTLLRLHAGAACRVPPVHSSIRATCLQRAAVSRHPPTPLLRRLATTAARQPTISSIRTQSPPPRRTPSTNLAPAFKYPEQVNIYLAPFAQTALLGAFRLGALLVLLAGNLVFAPIYFSDADTPKWTVPALALGSAAPFIITAMFGPTVANITVHLPLQARRSREALVAFSNNVPPSTRIRLQFIRFLPVFVKRTVYFEDLHRLPPSWTRLSNLEHVPWSNAGEAQAAKRKGVGAWALKLYLGRYWVNMAVGTVKKRGREEGVWERMWAQIPWMGEDGTVVKRMGKAIEKGVGTAAVRPPAARVEGPAGRERPRSADADHGGSAERAWQTVRNARGAANLNHALGEFLAAHTAMDLLGYVARVHGEDVTITRERFRLRRLTHDEAEDRKDVAPDEQRAKLVGMLLHELDLPGQRFSAALEEWKDEVVTAAASLEEVALRSAVLDFEETWDVQRLIRALQETHPEAAQRLVGRLLPQEGEHHVYGKYAVNVPVGTLRVIVAGVTAALRGAAIEDIRPLEPPEDRFYASSVRGWAYNDYAALAPLPTGADADADEQAEPLRGANISFRRFQSALWRSPFGGSGDELPRWGQLFHHLQQHARSFGLDDLIRASHSDLHQGIWNRLERHPEVSARRMGLLNHQFTMEDNVVAVLADGYLENARARLVTRGRIPFFLLKADEEEEWFAEDARKHACRDRERAAKVQARKDRIAAASERFAAARRQPSEETQRLEAELKALLSPGSWAAYLAEASSHFVATESAAPVDHDTGSPSGNRASGSSGPTTSPMGAAWTGIQNAIDHLRRERRDSAPLSPPPPEWLQNVRADGLGELWWQDIRAAQGRGKLERAIAMYLGPGTSRVPSVLDRLTETTDSRSAVKHTMAEEIDFDGTYARFKLRYLNLDDGEALSGHGEVEGIEAKLAQMLVDELDLPGQRFSTVLARWQSIEAEAREIGHSSSALQGDAWYESFSNLQTRIIAFTNDLGLQRLAEAFAQEHSAEALRIFRPLGFRITFDNHTVAHMQAPNETTEEVALLVTSGLLDLADTTRLTPTGVLLPGDEVPRWAHHIEDLFGGAAKPSVTLASSIDGLRDSTRRTDGILWRQVFHHVQSHIKRYGLESIMRASFDLLSVDSRAQLGNDPEGAARELGRLNYRYRPSDKFAAILADAYTTEARRHEAARRQANTSQSDNQPGLNHADDNEELYPSSPPSRKRRKSEPTPDAPDRRNGDGNDDDEEPPPPAAAPTRRAVVSVDISISTIPPGTLAPGDHAPPRRTRTRPAKGQAPTRRSARIAAQHAAPAAVVAGTATTQGSTRKPKGSAQLSPTAKVPTVGRSRTRQRKSVVVMSARKAAGY
ncbi:hypothetical protein LTR53_004390 [Teratosphaeriaceae sp. CCFEE 6253]|nr:hypothetical protein LTR53_004390 [Teratosphaeriaceae sp. CCFEE 6253]